MKRIWSIIFLFLFSKAFAHPHEWLSVTLTPILNNQNQIIALEQHWEFDPLFAQVVLEPVLKAKTKEDAKAKMQGIEKDITHNLSEAHFFTYSSTNFFTRKKGNAISHRRSINLSISASTQNPYR
ncbi:DUF1007 family protein [Suttonella ornithocola]|uniref:DUF1007 family protein n=1 Tax=Suttonella ornithocola TaxID=279832 RepID=UPI0009339830